MIFLFAFSTLAFLAALLILYWLHAQAWLDVHTPHVPPPKAGPLVSLIVPARNEEKNIRRCVQSLLAQDYPSLQILVLEDRSTDRTPVILAELAAQDPRLAILAGRDLPPGWAGKPHALH